MVRVFEPNALETRALDRSFVVPCSRPDTPPRPPRTLPPRHRPCSATDPSNRPEQRRSTHHGTRANRASAPAGPCAQLKVGVTVFNHPPPCAPILTLSYGPHPACATRVRNLNAAPGACSPHDMSRPVSTSACRLAMEPSNGVHTTPTQVTHNHHHHHHHHHHRSLLRRLLTQLTGLGARSTSLHVIAEGECGAVGGRVRRESKSASGDASSIQV